MICGESEWRWLTLLRASVAASVNGVRPRLLTAFNSAPRLVSKSNIACAFLSETTCDIGGGFRHVHIGLYVQPLETCLAFSCPIT